MPNAPTASASCQASSQQPAPAAHPVSDLRDERRPRGTPPQRAAEKGKGFADGRPRYMVAACTMYDDVLSNRRRRRRRRTPLMRMLMLMLLLPVVFSISQSELVGRRWSDSQTARSDGRSRGAQHMYNLLPHLATRRQRAARVAAAMNLAGSRCV